MLKRTLTRFLAILSNYKLTSGQFKLNLLPIEWGSEVKVHSVFQLNITTFSFFCLFYVT